MYPQKKLGTFLPWDPQSHLGFLSFPALDQIFTYPAGTASFRDGQSLSVFSMTVHPLSWTGLCCAWELLHLVTPEWVNLQGAVATSHSGPSLQVEGTLKMEPVHPASSPSSASCLISAREFTDFSEPNPLP